MSTQLTISGVFLAAAVVTTIWYAVKPNIPLWVPVLFIEIAMLAQFIPAK